MFSYLSGSALVGDILAPEHILLKGPVPAGEFVGELEGYLPKPTNTIQATTDLRENNSIYINEICHHENERD